MPNFPNPYIITKSTNIIKTIAYTSTINKNHQHFCIYNSTQPKSFKPLHTEAKSYKLVHQTLKGHNQILYF